MVQDDYMLEDDQATPDVLIEDTINVESEDEATRENEPRSLPKVPRRPGEPHMLDLPAELEDLDWEDPKLLLYCPRKGEPSFAKIQFLRNNEVPERLCTAVKERHRYFFESPERWTIWKDELYSLVDGLCLPGNVIKDFDTLTSPLPSHRQDLPQLKPKHIAWYNNGKLNGICAQFHVGFILDLMTNNRKLSYYIRHYSDAWSHLFGTADCSVHGTLEHLEVNLSRKRCHGILNCMGHNDFEACNIDARRHAADTEHAGRMQTLFRVHARGKDVEARVRSARKVGRGGIGTTAKSYRRDHLHRAKPSLNIMDTFKNLYLRVGTMNGQDVWATYTGSRRYRSHRVGPEFTSPPKKVKSEDNTFLPEMGRVAANNANPYKLVVRRIKKTWQARFYDDDIAEELSRNHNEVIVQAPWSAFDTFLREDLRKSLSPNEE